MKYLIICNGYPKKNESNIYIFVHRQALALKEAGNTVAVLDIDLRSIRWKRRFGFFRENYDGIDVYRFSFPFVTVIFKDLYSKLNKRIGVYCAKRIFHDYGKMDIVCPHFAMGAGEAAIAIKKKYCIPVVLTEHSSRILSSDDVVLNRYKYVYDSADATITVGQALSNKLKKHGINNTVIPNVIDTEIFKPYHIKSKKNKIFLSVGSLQQRKRFDLFIRAFSKVQTLMPNSEAIIIGSGDLKKELKSLALELNVRHLKFINSVTNDKMPKYYSMADCFVLPSDFETFGMVYAEAIACGTPAVGTANGGAQEIITLENGIIIPKNDPDSLANAMMHIIDNTYDKNELHQYIEQNFGVQHFLNEYNIICKRILSKYDR